MMIQPPPHAIAQGGSIANLIQSIGQSLGSGDAFLPPLEHPFIVSALSQARTIVLLLFDGLGCAQIQTHLPRGALAGAHCATLTSVFPSSTAPAISTLASGLDPAAHAVTGWLIWSESHQAVVRPLPSDRRGQPDALIDPDTLHDWTALSQRVQRPCVVLQPSHIADSPFSRFAWRGASRLGYRRLQDLERTIVAQTQLMQHQAGGFIYAYLPHFDSVAHEHGWLSRQAFETAQTLDALFARLRSPLESLGVLLLATADHGFVDIQPRQQLQLQHFPDLARCLAAPLWGEPRVAFCRVRPELTSVFLDHFQQQLAHAFDLYESQALAQSGWFGSSTISPTLDSRIGDFTLIARDGYTLVDRMPGEHAHAFIGMHGGPSAAEMKVSLALAAR
jgi:hypothetical protein